MKETPNSARWFLCLIALIGTLACAAFVCSSSRVTFSDEVDRQEATRIFAIAKPLINARIHTDVEKMTYRVSEYEGRWVILVFHVDHGFVAVGRLLTMR